MKTNQPKAKKKIIKKLSANDLELKAGKVTEEIAVKRVNSLINLSLSAQS